MGKKKKNVKAKRLRAKHELAKSARKWSMKHIILGIGIFLVALILSYVGYHYYSSKGDSTPTTVQTPPDSTPSSPKEGKITQWTNPPPMSINQSKEYLATIKTSFGDIVVRLFPKDAPITINNFVFLARQGFYDSLKFHRVVKGFVIQTGDPKGNGTGGPGYKFADEKVNRDYVKGTLAMANSGLNTNGSQFFITLADLAGKLPKNYTIFGEVTNGFDVVQKIGDVPVKAALTGEVSIPTVDVFIVSVTIDEK